MTLDTTTLGGWITAVLQLIGGVLRLNVDAFHAAVDHPRGLGLAVAVFMAAGLSVGLGQSTVRRSSSITMSTSVSKGRWPRSAAMSPTERPLSPRLASL